MLWRRALRRFALGSRFDAGKDYYKVLGLAPTADKEQVRRAYIAMVKRFHPDKGAQNDTKIKEINEANEVLSDDALRKEYDQARVSAASAGGPGSFQQAYHQSGQYSNPFGQRQRRRQAEETQFYRDAQENTRDYEGRPKTRYYRYSSRGSQDFDALYEEFRRHFQKMNEQMSSQRHQSDRSSRQEGWTSAADQANSNWSRAEHDYQEMQKQKEERARADLVRNLLHLRNTWHVFRSSAAQKGLWRGLFDAFVYYRSSKE